MTDPNPSLENTTVAAILAQRSREDSSELLEDLVATLVETVPGAQVQRALITRHVKRVRVPLAGYVYQLKRGSNGAFEASRLQEVRGVVVRTVPMEIDAFLAEFGLALDEELRRTEQGRQALRAWMDSSSK